MGFFQPTQEEIDKAASGGQPKFKSGEEVHFLIKEVSEKSTDKGEDMLVVVCELLNTEHKGKDYKHFIRSNPAGWGVWMSLLNTFLTDDQIKAGIQPSAPIGRKVKATAKVSAKDGREYVNFYNFTAVDGAPDIGGASAGDSKSSGSIPF